MQLSQRQLYIIFGGLGLIIVIMLLLYFGSKPGAGGKVELRIWGTFDDSELFNNISASWLQETGHELSYVRKNPETYEEELLDALAAGSGPDIFFFKNSWLLKHYDKVRPAPENLFTPADIDENYPQIVYRDFVSGRNVYGLPLYIDTLALFYNPALFDQAAIPFPPKTWEEVIEMVPRLTKTTDRRDIDYSAIALGSAKNVDHATDILSLLMIQSGSEIVNDDLEITFQKSQAGVEALNFFTQFAKSKNKVYTWDERLNNSIEEFANGKVAMAIGYASDIEKIRAVSPYLKFKITFLPQPEDAEMRKDYANYWGLAVNKQSKKWEVAWSLIANLAENQQTKNFSQITNLPPAKRYLLNQVRSEPIMEIFSKQAFTAVSWPQPNSKLIERAFSQGIADALSERLPTQEIVSNMAKQIDQMFKTGI